MCEAFPSTPLSCDEGFTGDGVVFVLRVLFCFVGFSGCGGEGGVFGVLVSSFSTIAYQNVDKHHLKAKVLAHTSVFRTLSRATLYGFLPPAQTGTSQMHAGNSPGMLHSLLYLELSAWPEAVALMLVSSGLSRS